MNNLIEQMKYEFDERLTSVSLLKSLWILMKYATLHALIDHILICRIRAL